MKKIQTFDDDLLGLSEFADRLGAFIAVERRYVPGSLVVSLDGRFGHGKTTFLTMWKARIEGQAEGARPQLVLLNAWTSDFLGDPLSAIVASLENALGSQTPAVIDIVEAAKDIGRFAIAIGGQFVAKQTGVDFASAGNYAQGHRKDGIAATNNEPYTAYKCRAAALEKLKSAIGQLAAETQDGVIIFVDELDRCRPDYAISYLETIKHVFDITGLTFILAIDRRQLESVAKAAFGEGLDFSEYYRKFIHREVSMPEPTEEGRKKLASAYVAEYMEPTNQRQSIISPEHVQNFRLVDLIANLRLTPRQLQEVFRVLGHVGALPSEEQLRRLEFINALGVSVMAALKVGASDIYHAIGRGGLEASVAKSFAVRHCPDFTDLVRMFFFGGGLAVADGITFEEFARGNGFSEAETNSLLDGGHVSPWARWEREDVVLRGFYRKIEHVSQFQ